MGIIIMAEIMPHERVHSKYPQALLGALIYGPLKAA